MFNLRQMECLVALDDKRNFSHAADFLGLTQSALTQSIQRLETQFDAPLFSRERGQIAPTIFGEVLIQSARQMLTINRTAAREVDLLRNMETGRIIVGVDPQLAGALLAQSLKRLSIIAPGLRIQTISGDWNTLCPDLADRNIDLFLGFAGSHPDKRFIEKRRFIQPPLILCSPLHPAASTPSVRLADLLGYQWVTPRSPEWAMDWFRVELDNPELTYDDLPMYISSDDLNMVKQLAVAGVGLMSAYRSDVKLELELGLLSPLNVENWPEFNEITIVTLLGRTLPPAAHELINQILLSSNEIAAVKTTVSHHS